MPFEAAELIQRSQTIQKSLSLTLLQALLSFQNLHHVAVLDDAFFNERNLHQLIDPRIEPGQMLIDELDVLAQVSGDCE